MNNSDRQKAARDIRIDAANLAFNRHHPNHIANGDEYKFRRETDSGKNKPSYLASFTKGLAHNDDDGLVSNPDDFQQLVKGIDSGDPRDFIDTPLGPQTDCDGKPKWRSEKAQTSNDGGPVNVRAWESQGAGNTFDLEGPDAQAVTMPPAPKLGSDELIAEMAEVYAQALLRDVPFTDLTKENPPAEVKAVLNALNELEWFKRTDNEGLSPEEISRRRRKLTCSTAFRGITPGDDIGPYISQFLLAGNKGVNSKDKAQDPCKGYITYGAVRIDQRVRFAKPGDDHMTKWDEWLDVQDGADLRSLENYVKCDDPYRFITTPRDLATYVHYDALYEAYLNACLIMLADGVPFDPGLPFQQDDAIDHQQAFAHFGGPHILSLVTEVATRALKAVRYQKFNVHRRMRPEVLAARLTQHNKLGVSELDDMVKALRPILNMVKAKNPKDNCLKTDNYLLPMAFCEGSPMHPAYGAGHATVAGACVTILKAFFDHTHPVSVAGCDTQAFVPNEKGELITIPVTKGPLKTEGRLTVEGELNKLASNIAIGRNWAGVHYFTDYIESIRMGEQIAIGILEEQKLTYGENFSMTIPLFDGGAVRI